MAFLRLASIYRIEVIGPPPGPNWMVEHHPSNRRAVAPILIGPDCRVINGWALVLAAKQLGWRKIPVARICDLSEELRLPFGRP